MNIWKNFLIITLLIFVTCEEDKVDTNPFEQEHIEWPSLADSPWPTFRHDYQGTGRFEGVGPSSTNYEILYEPDVGINRGSVSIGHNNHVVFNTTCKLTYIDLEGNLLWEADMCEYLSVSSAESYHAPIITSDSTIIICSWDKHIYCFDEGTGDKIWDYDVGHLIDNTPLLGLDGTVYLSSDSGTFAIDKDGLLKWRKNQIIYPSAFSPNGLQIYGIREGEFSLVAMDLTGNIVWENNLFRTGYFVVDNDGNIYGANHLEKTILSVNENGNLRWSISVENISSEYEIRGTEGVSPTLDVFGRLNYIISDYENNSHLIRITVEGEIEQKIELNVRGFGTPLVSDISGTTYIASFFGGDSTRYKVIGIDSDGEVVMEVANGNYGYYGCPAFTNEGYLIYLPSWQEIPMKLKVYK